MEPKQQKGKNAKAKSDIDAISELGWVIMGKSKLSLFHKPTFKQLELLQKEKGLTLVVTLNHATEKADVIGKYCSALNLNWENYPLRGANVPLLQSKEASDILISGITNIYQGLHLANQVVIIHCSAGIHRTGVFAYSLLRLIGNTPPKAMDLLKEMREHTWKGVGDKRIEFVEKSLLNTIRSHWEEIGYTPLVKDKEIEQIMKQVEDTKLEEGEEKEEEKERGDMGLP